MSRAELGFRLELGEEDPFKVDLLLLTGSGPTVFTAGPAEGQKAESIGEVVLGIAEMLGLESEIGPLAHLTEAEPWRKIFDTRIKPSLTIAISQQKSVALAIELFDKDENPGITLPGSTPSWLTIEPEFTVYSLIVSYEEGKGMGVRAKVAFAEQEKAQELNLLVGAEPAKKTELVSFPFPTPPPANSNLQVKYLGLGQRFGPNAPVEGVDPLKAIFDELETKFASNDPAKVVGEMAEYYQADRGWFFGADIILRGWRVRALLNDPAFYGVEVTCETEPYEGLLIEILYQKLGSGVGVFYGALTMPEKFRTLQLGAVSLTIPSFKIWIYTNGDFKVSVGWPLGPNSIGVQVYVFTGGGGFYFAKLRSADKPNSAAPALRAAGMSVVSQETPPVKEYNPILEFGLGAWFGVGRSFSSGPLSASLSLTVQGTFQGLLAWESSLQNGSRRISEAPDYHWFAATVGILGVLQGEVDLSIVSLSVLVQIEATAGIAVETDYGTNLEVNARVDVTATLRIAFIKIHVGFHASIGQTFEISQGKYGTASIAGPENPSFHGMNDLPMVGVEAIEASLRERAQLRAAAEPQAVQAAPAPSTPQTIPVGFLLQPSIVYPEGASMGCAVATLVVSNKVPTGAKESPLALLVESLAGWLLRSYGSEGGWKTVVEKLARKSGPVDWESKLQDFIAEEVSFKLEGIDLPLERGSGSEDVAFLPMFENLQMTCSDKAKVVFGEQAPTYPNYRDVVAAYFAELSLKGLVSPMPEKKASEVAPSAEEGGPPPGSPPLARFVFADYFLTVSRHLAQLMEKGKSAADVALEVGGIGSRYLLNGLRLPNPATAPGPGEPIVIKNLDIVSGYVLTGQQIPVDPKQASFTATLEKSPVAGSMAAAIEFAEGSSATSSMPVKEPPAAPVPVWKGLNEGVGAAGGGTIDLEAMPLAIPRPRWVVARTRLPWNQPQQLQQPQAIVPLPPEVGAATREGPLKLIVQEKPPPETAPHLQVTPALLVSVRAHLVDRLREGDVKRTPSARAGNGEGQPQAPEPESPYVPGVYRLDGADDATRAQLAAALGAGALKKAKLSVLYDGESSGYKSGDVDLKQVLLAKTNLSTTSQPASGLMAPLRLRELGEDLQLGPVSASLEEVPDFARLLWELSVVQTGGFFLRYRDKEGHGLPPSIFKEAGGMEKEEEATGDSAELTLAITFPEDGETLQSWHNAFVVAPPPTPESLYLELLGADGAPLQDLHPAFPPGCVGFEGTWALAKLLAEETGDKLYSEDWIAQLYHLLQFKVGGAKSGSKVKFGSSPWSLALSPIDRNDGKGAEETPSDCYRQVLPAFRFVEKANNGGEPTPYDAVGGTVELDFCTGDVFGNVLGGSAYQGSLSLLYNDPLVGPGEWPGVKVGHRFLLDANLDPMLRLVFEFDPKAVVRPGVEKETAKEQAETALSRYAIAIAQLQDPRTEMRLATSVLPSPGAVGDPQALKQSLLAYAVEIQKQLTKVVKDKEAAELCKCEIDNTIEIKLLAKLETDVVPVEVTLGMSRPKDLVYVGPGGKPVDKSDSAILAVAPDLAPTKKPSSLARARADASGLEAGQIQDVTLLPYAEDFEKAFKGWAGEKSTFRLAIRSDQEDLSAPAGTSPLWGLRMSSQAGIDVKFATGKAAYFSLAPLDVKLWNGEAEVPIYEEQQGELKPSYNPQTFTGIDLDRWAEGFLAAMDEVLSPAIGTALAAADNATYQRLMKAKSVLAQALAAGVVPVFEGTDAEVVAGDKKSAREVFEQALLGRLSAAFSISALVQVPATVTVHGPADGAAAPRLFGPLIEGDKANAESADRVSLGTAKLELKNAPSESGFLTFPVSVAEPESTSSVELSPHWDAHFVEDLLEGEAQEFGYKPSEWLRLARRLKEDPFDYKLGSLQVPVPSRHYPPNPVLEGQSATQSKSGAANGSLAEYLFWDYGVNLKMSELAAQDMLCLQVEYNRPLEDVKKMVGEAPELPEALASFTVAWPTLRPYLQALQHGADEKTGKKAILPFLEQVKVVTRAWAAHAGLPDPWPEERLEGPALIRSAKPAGERSDRYVVDFQKSKETPPTLSVYARVPQSASEPVIWPLINGKGPLAKATKPPPAPCFPDEVPVGEWLKAEYEFAREEDQLELVWPHLDVLGLQTACTACWRLRNANLGSRETNPAFVYRTPEVEFPNPVVPSIVVPAVGPLKPESTLAKTLAKALAPLATAGKSVSEHRLVKLSCDYEFSLAGPEGAAVWARNAILLADQVVLLPEGAGGTQEAQEGVTLTKLCEQLATNCGIWYSHYRPSTAEAKLTVAVVLFATVSGRELPVIQVPDLQLTVDPGWWGG